MRFRVLGPLEVDSTAPPGAKERAVLARLLLDPGQVVTVDALLDAAWPGIAPDVAARSLQVRLARLRALLEPGRDVGAPSSALVRDGRGYRLVAGPADVDATVFEALVAEAAGLAPAEAVAAYDRALALWRGPAFLDVADADFAQPRIRELEDLRDAAHEARAAALVDAGRHADALPVLRRLAAEAPLRESVARALALALYRAGRQVEALDVVRDVATRLRAVGLETSAETPELERRILVHDPVLAPAGDRVARPPRRPGPLFGRDADVARVQALLREPGLVTLVGTGGVGKTRLALEVAARHAGACWCELASLPRGGDVAGAVADALGAAGEDGLERAAAALAARGGLVVLDNAEHVLERAAAVAERLLACSPDARVLATGRAPLALADERVVRLPGLALPADGEAADVAASPAVALFLDRSGTAGAEPADLPAVAALCRRLDGLPLAIELAAVRARSMTPADIMARLRERPGLLAVAGRRGPARHTTLQAAIAWSHDLLTPAERRLYARLSVFPRDWTLEAAEAVCAGDGIDPRDVPELLDALVAASMVVAAPAADGRMRYGMLQTLREHAAAQLAASGELALLRDRHADHWAARSASAMASGWQARRLPLVEAFEDLRAALRWILERDPGPERAFVIAEALWWPALSRHGEEIAALVEEVLGRWPEGDDAGRVRALGTAAVVRLVVGDARAARRHAAAALALERVGEPALMARRALAQLAFFGAGPAAAAEAWEDLAARARRAGIPALACEADGFTAQLLAAMGSVEVAGRRAAPMRAEAEALRSPLLVTWSCYVSGIVALERDPEQARGWLEQALARAGGTDHHHMARFCLRALGVAATLEGAHAEAAGRLLAALAHDEGISDAASQRATLMALGVLLAERGRLDAAAQVLAATQGWPVAPYLAGLARVARSRLSAALDPDRLAEATRRGTAATLAACKALARAEVMPASDARAPQARAVDPVT